MSGHPHLDRSEHDPEPQRGFGRVLIANQRITCITSKQNISVERHPPQPWTIVIVERKKCQADKWCAIKNHLSCKALHGIRQSIKELNIGSLAITCHGGLKFIQNLKLDGVVNGSTCSHRNDGFRPKKHASYFIWRNHWSS